MPEDCKNSLIEYCDLVGITVPRGYGKGEVTTKLKLVEEHSKTKKSWEVAPAEAKKQWQQLLNHNRFDVESMYELMIRIIGMAN